MRGRQAWREGREHVKMASVTKSGEPGGKRDAGGETGGEGEKKKWQERQGNTLVSEGIDANYTDIINYAIFALIHLKI